MNEPQESTPIEVIAKDCLLYAHRIGDEIHVYRSVLVRDTDDLYRPVAELVGGAEQVHRETVADPGMGFGRAEVLVYRASQAVAA
ncbi:hypothetical protein [Mycolicibacterium diernhoferi]|uniref:Uncharacterized protein n=1 Tax=Mycolicibacterium diernhoferi TaxID=1801 RepID=A0A1Q4HKY8_9MYCO|nr:hypothetical protein [Mycolicibacterium diernhoferi]OJZ68173.1 hypothetical protein BRW64_00835 [Mycolicibacterium diernhoferi]OPE55761.1 hypothetical protein BV510_03450 [Mycolicibacterium diernhoferi]PEG56266.1 hypothetical protein CRI78_02555 [Mycolicibacterium diernhoferi]QYL21339.1 hypothetical protein K0O62_20245 [Mycolicibacterium diernhoferi]